MKPDEMTLLARLLACAHRHMEFGAGGSTCLAAPTVAGSITFVDSSREWLDKVAAACSANAYAIQPTLINADIGELLDCGWPRDDTQSAQWPAYPKCVEGGSIPGHFLP